MEHIIKKIGYHDEYGAPQEITCGKNGVKKIEQHSVRGEGDRWYYDVIYEDNRGLMIFDPKVVEYEKVESEINI